ncbi:uncharacterized protein SPSK_00950 [Sporothrix schenckii 1099-18]|uniref:Uncharacterized protein n=1 Tax=Sporothrix schenckii 1099-18 TaxID=1397361 RepID=A0A0F2LW21_SPOSC|nr:uncharacterized protein SPSK_00950 [Sporothrix schenckii 1099-18]KJR81653.1 hypothetical protein SPSK_00950 [Sporothrix schenckii 1099-18]
MSGEKSGNTATVKDNWDNEDKRAKEGADHKQNDTGQARWDWTREHPVQQSSPTCLLRTLLFATFPLSAAHFPYEQPTVNFAAVAGL